MLITLSWIFFHHRQKQNFQTPSKTGMYVMFILKMSISRNVTFCIITRYNVSLIISSHLQLSTRVRKLLNFDEFFANFLFYRYVFKILGRNKELSALNRGRSEVLFLISFFSNYFPYAILTMTKAWGHLWQTRCPRNMVINYLSLVTTEKHLTQSSTTGWSSLDLIAVRSAIITKRDWYLLQEVVRSI